MLRASGLSSRSALVLQNHDLLSCGPLARGASLRQWRALRQRYLRSVFFDDLPTFLFSREPRDLLTNLPVLRRAQKVVFWLGTGLIDQLLVSWLVGEAEVIGADPRDFRVMQFHRHGMRGYDILSIAILNPDDLRELAQGVEATPIDVDETRAAWEAVTSPEPDQLVGFCSRSSTQLSLLKSALVTLLRRYPDARTGLNFWDYELLKYCGEVGPRAVRVVGHTMGSNMETPDWPGDSYLFARLRRLGDSRLRHPLVRFSGRLSRIRSAEVSLTDVGSDVLAGRANPVTLNGIDDWVGGVHLDSSAGRVWFHQDGRLTVT